MRHLRIGFASLAAWISLAAPDTAAEPQARHVLSVAGTSFLLDGKPFPYTGLSFFNALYNPSFNASTAARRSWLERFERHGINVLRIWAQWDNRRGFTDAGPDSTLYHPDGRLRDGHIATLHSLLDDADAAGFVVELCLFSQESLRDGRRLDPAAADRAVANLARELERHRNLTFQVWNEYSERTLDLRAVIKREDPARLVTSSPGFAGVLGSDDENRALDYLTPHTSRQSQGKPWERAPREIARLIARFNKPVVDDEPARTGTSQFGGPRETTSPFDHVIQIWRVWEVGGYVTYHHDMFQTGYGSPSVPPSGVPDPEFSTYHRQVFEFLRLRTRFVPTGRREAWP